MLIDWKMTILIDVSINIVSKENIIKERIEAEKADISLNLGI